MTIDNGYDANQSPDSGDAGHEQAQPGTEQSPAPSNDPIDRLMERSDAKKPGDGTVPGAQAPADSRTAGQQGNRGGRGGDPKSQQGQKPQRTDNRAPDQRTEAHRHWERAENYRKQAEQATVQHQALTRQVQDLTARLTAYEQANSLPTRYGVQPQDVELGVKLLTNYRRDPQGTLNFLLQEAKAKGHNLAGLGGSQVDTAAISRIIEERLSPFTQQLQQQRQQQEAQQRAYQEQEAFYGRYPDARIHDQSLAQLMQRSPGLTADAAYYALKNWYLVNNANFSEPLPQVLARMNGQQQPGNTQRNGQQPMPRGRGNGQLQAHQPSMAASSDTYGDIARSVLAERGMS